MNLLKKKKIEIDLRKMSKAREFQNKTKFLDKREREREKEREREGKRRNKKLELKFGKLLPYNLLHHMAFFNPSRFIQ